MRDPLAEAPACGSRVPVAFRPPALASRVILRPLGSPAFLTVGLPDEHRPPGPRRGCHVPHEAATTGMGALCTPGTVVRSRPAKFPRPSPAASQRPFPISHCINPSAGVLMTRRHRGFTCVHPSGLPQPVTPGWNGGPWSIPRASHPAVTRDARRGGDGLCALDRALHLQPQSNLLRCVPLLSCDLVSHHLVQPGGVDRQVDQREVLPCALQPVDRRPAPCELPLSTTQNTRRAEAYGSLVIT